MSNESARRGTHLLLLGFLWGGFAYLLGYRAFGPSIWGGVLGAPLIGLAVGRLIQGPFERSAGWRRRLLPLGTVYLGATLFGLGIGLFEWIRRSVGLTSLPQLMAESVGAVWWGVTVTGFLLFLWPLAFGTHWLLEWWGDN